MKIPTNVEMIYDETLNNCLLIPIPTTKFAIIGEFKKEFWQVSIISKMGSTKKIVSKNMSDAKFNVLIQKTLAFRDLQHLKHKIKIKDLINFYKKVIKAK